MGRRKNASVVGCENNEFDVTLSSLLDVISGEDKERKCLAHALNNLAHALQRKVVSSPEDKWFRRMEQSATLVRETCKQFQEDSACQREEVYHLLRALEGRSRDMPSHGDLSFDPVRGMLVCRSFMASYRLQAQQDEQVVGEVVSFLSTLYADVDFASDSGELNDPETYRVEIIPRISGWIDHLENQVFLSSPPWRDALLGIQCSYRPDEKSKKFYHEANELELTEECINNTSSASELKSFINSGATSETVMGAVESFLGAVVNGNTFSSFLFVMGPQGSGKTYLCHKIEERAQKHDFFVQGT